MLQDQKTIEEAGTLRRSALQDDDLLTQGQVLGFE